MIEEKFEKESGKKQKKEIKKEAIEAGKAIMNSIKGIKEFEKEN